MKLLALAPLAAIAAAALVSAPASAAEATITVTNPLTSEARPDEVIVVPFADVAKLVPGGLRMHHFVVKDAATGAEVPSQVSNYEHDHRGARYDDLVFQHDFAKGEATAKFAIETREAPVPPYETKTFARFVPERLDDFAWENDRIAFRTYGPRLDSAEAEALKERLRSSGFDVWGKRVRYPVVDRWYAKGHDQFHTDTGEGLDLYSIGGTRGAGGTGVWAADKLHVAGNFTAWRVLTNGPIRTVFELDYGPTEAGAGLTVRETKRVTLDAGRNFNLVESTFTLEGADAVKGATIAAGLSKPRGGAKLAGVERDERLRTLSLWQEQPKDIGSIGLAVVVPPAQPFAGFTEDDAQFLALMKATSGQPVRFYCGAGWDRSGDFADRAAWDAYVAAFARRLAHPVTVTLGSE